MSYQDMAAELKDLAKGDTKFAYTVSEQYIDGKTPSVYQYRKDTTIVKFSQDVDLLRIVGVSLIAELPKTGYVNVDIFYKDNVLHYASASQKIKPRPDVSQEGLKALIAQIKANEELDLFLSKLEEVLDWVVNVDDTGNLIVSFGEGGYVDFPLIQFDLPEENDQDSSVIE